MLGSGAWWKEVYVPGATEARLTAAVLPAIAFLIIVHGAVLAGFLAALRLCRKTSTTNRCRQNRKQNFGGSLVHDPKSRQCKNRHRALALPLPFIICMRAQKIAHEDKQQT